MKRVGFLFEKIVAKDNILLAIKNSSKGKKGRRIVRKVLGNADYYADIIVDLLVSKNYKPAPYKRLLLYDGANQKEREICKPQYFPDQIIHWALIQIIEPILMRGMYYYSCGSIPGRGSKLGVKSIRKWLDSDIFNTKYCLKLDVKKFYPTIDNHILEGMFRRKIKDEKCLWLIDAIVDSAVGLPIGNYTSQWFSNFFLEGLDHFIKENLGVKYYIRYVDDLVLLGSNKRKLHKVRKSISEYLTSVNLTIKSNWQVFPVSKRAIDFLGYKFHRNKTVLRRRNALRIRRRYKKINKKNFLNVKDAYAIIAYNGWIVNSDSYIFYQKHKPKYGLKKSKEAVSNYAKGILRKDS